MHVLCYFFVFIFFRVAGTVPCRPDLMVKKLRYYARFIVVCLLLKKMKLVRDLVRVSAAHFDSLSALSSQCRSFSVKSYPVVLCIILTQEFQ